MSEAKQTAVRASKYTIIGILLTLINFVIYTIIAQIVQNSDFLWLISMVSYALTAVIAYILHSRITWRERHPGKSGVCLFFLWNFISAFLISPVCTELFTHITPVYVFAFNISSALHLPFDYYFVESTGVFCFTCFVTMVLNYLCYDKLVFGKFKTKPEAG